MTKPIESSVDERIPPFVQTPQAMTRFASVFNVAILSDIPEDMALDLAEQAVITPEDRAEMLGETEIDLNDQH